MEEWWVKVRVIDPEEGRKVMEKIRECVVEVPEAVSLVKVKNFGECFAVVERDE